MSASQRGCVARGSDFGTSARLAGGRALRIPYLGPLAQPRCLEELTPRECHSSQRGLASLEDSPVRRGPGIEGTLESLHIARGETRAWASSPAGARVVGEQAGASPLRFTQFRSLNNLTEETRHDWSVWV
ncbi:hypothetical protein U0070_009229 [Myodes glareolus]|uniref:Uncharacterized protein n=1 Tax=Myodes glareolus TaxID=447135 RepID=A0AAW0IQV8_MYOGA